jgi:hypothetical protein
LHSEVAIIVLFVFGFPIAVIAAVGQALGSLPTMQFEERRPRCLAAPHWQVVIYLHMSFLLDLLECSSSSNGFQHVWSE